MKLFRTPAINYNGGAMMKKALFTIVFTLLSLSIFAQQLDTRRKIEVTGSAEQEVTPDIIYLTISLREYIKENIGKKKIDITTLEKQLQSAVLNAGIPKENFTINNVSGYNYDWQQKKNPEFLASKQYRIKVTDLKKVNDILSAVDPKGIQYTNIDSYDYSKIEPLKRELKIKALQAAKEKAAYLAEALDDKLGDAIEVQEINNEFYPQPIYRANVMMKSDSNFAEGGAPEVDFKKIKLNYQMRVVFELK